MVLDGVDLDATIQKMIEESIRSAVDFYCAKNIPSEDWNLDGLRSKYAWLLKNKEDVNSDMSHDEVYETLLNLAMERFNHQKALYGEELMRALEHKILLENVDIRWMEHIDAMEQLKTGIGLRAYAQKDPVVAFRQESFDMFEEMTENIRDGTVQMLLTAVVRTEKDTERQQQAEITSQSGGDGSDKQRPVKKKESEKVGRNDPCPCGSGLKYKKCCGR